MIAAFAGGRPEADFERAARLGVSGFPTRLAVSGFKAVALAHGHATAEEIEERPAALR